MLLLEYAPPGCLVMTSAPPTRTALRMFEALGVASDRVAQITGPILCNDLYLGDRPVRLASSVHALAREAFERLKALGSGSEVQRRERIFISRPMGAERLLEQHHEVEALFERNGFAIVHPEKLPIEDQIALFSGAKMIAGLGGSAMHNAVFASPDCPMLILQTRSMGTRVDITLAEPERRLGYVFGRTVPLGSPFSSPWRIDLRDAEAGLRLHFGL
jgi:capsular polysaccharide biosynthesis protein